MNMKNISKQQVSRPQHMQLHSKLPSTAHSKLHNSCQLLLVLQVVPRVTDPACVLPKEVMQMILQHVPQQHRLTVAAIVCKAWATAAAHATVHVQQALSKPTAKAFQRWLATNSAHLVSLQLTFQDPAADIKPLLLQLPCNSLANLQRLYLSKISLQVLMGHSTSSAGRDSVQHSSSITCRCMQAGPLLPSLREVTLSSCHLASPEALVQLVSHAPGLTQLVVYWPTWRSLDRQ